MKKRKVQLHTKILLGLVVGAILGVGANLFCRYNPAATPGIEWGIRNVAIPIGQIFLRFLFMTVVPLVLSTLAVGVANLGDLKKIGRIGLRTIVYFLGTTALAVTIGLFLVNLARPGEGFDKQVQERLLTEYRGMVSQSSKTFEEHGGFGMQLLIQIVPRNPVAAMAEGDMLAVIFFSLVLGIATTRVKEEHSRPVVSFLQGLSEVMIAIVRFVMKMAPVAVPALIFSVTARFGLDVLEKLSLYVLTVLAGYVLFLFGVFSILVRFFARMNPLRFFKTIIPVMVTAFSTSSSNATLPTTLRTVEDDLGVPKNIAGFVIPLGATLNMNGTALFEGVTVLFLAQVFGIPLTLGHQAIVVVLSVLMAVGTAGVPGASIPMIMLVLSTVGVPADSIALILGVDRLLDMGRTVLNVTGDVTAAVYIARVEANRAGAPPAPAEP